MTERHQLERGMHRLSPNVVLGARPCSRLVDGLARENAERDRDGERGGELGERSRDGMSENVEVRCLATNQTAKRHHRVEAPGSSEEPDRRRQLEGPRDLELLHRRVLGERGLQGAAGERTGDFVVPARSDDGYPRSALRILLPGRSLPRGRHIPQSSPRMHSRSVVG